MPKTYNSINTHGKNNYSECMDKVELIKDEICKLYETNQKADAIKKMRNLIVYKNKAEPL